MMKILVKLGEDSSDAAWHNYRKIIIVIIIIRVKRKHK